MLAQRSAAVHGACSGAELTGAAAAARATRQLGSVTRSSSTRLLARASVVEAHQFGRACVELDGAHGGKVERRAGATAMEERG
jgi:hypothetical protein